MKKGTSLCVYSPKGGTGKTILAMNLAGICSLKEKKVLLIDLDLFNGGLSLLVDEDIKNKNIFKLSEDVSNNSFKDMNNYIIKYNKYIDFLCAPKDPRDAVKINMKFISSLIDKMEYSYDLVIVDTSSYLDKINVNVLNESDNILLVVTNDLMSIKNTKNMVTIFKETNVDYFKVILNESVDNIDKYFTSKEIKNIIGANVDYLLDDTFYIKDLTSYIFNRKIPVLDKNIFDNYKKEIKKLNNILDDIFSKEVL
jgi:pilus assembly protein CpaE